MSIIQFLYLAAYSAGALLFAGRNHIVNARLKSKANSKLLTVVGKTLASFMIVALLIFFITQSLSIAISLALLLSYLPQLHSKTRKRKNEELRRKCWPQVVDQLASATHSGVPLHRALNEMQERGPVPLAPLFSAFGESFRKEGSLERGLVSLVESAHSSSPYGYDEVAVKIKSTILMARDCGGLEVGPVLRNLSAFLRQRERTINEISVKQEWIKNGAALASITPWLLLILLSFNSGTKEAFGDNGGRTVLLVGLALTLVAYQWISRISESVSPAKLW